MIQKIINFDDVTKEGKKKTISKLAYTFLYHPYIRLIIGVYGSGKTSSFLI